MAQLLRTPFALAEDSNSVPHTQVRQLKTSHDSSSGRYNTLLTEVSVLPDLATVQS